MSGARPLPTLCEPGGSGAQPSRLTVDMVTGQRPHPSRTQDVGPPTMPCTPEWSRGNIRRALRARALHRVRRSSHAATLAGLSGHGHYTVYAGWSHGYFRRAPGHGTLPTVIDQLSRTSDTTSNPAPETAGWDSLQGRTQTCRHGAAAPGRGVSPCTPGRSHGKRRAPGHELTFKVTPIDLLNMGRCKAPALGKAL